jgi:zinc/manganese transport system substrate-binding protein
MSRVVTTARRSLAMISRTRARSPLIVLALCAAVLAPGAAAAADRLQVVTTTVQVTALTRAVAGDLIELRGIVPAGADPHEFEPVASDLVAVERAGLILRHGIGLDDWLDRTLKAGKGATVVTVTRGIRLEKIEEDGHTVDDPHVWHDPANTERMVENIAAALDGADPAHRGHYDANAGAYRSRLEEARVEVQAIIDTILPANRKLVTNHDAFGYFARAFGLRIVGAVIPNVSTAAEPSANETAKLLRTIRREGVKAIFAESTVNPKLAASLAREAGVKIVDDLYGDSLGPPGSGAETVEGMWLANARKIADALK